MKTYLSILMILLASLLVGCDESPVAATYSEPLSQDVVQSSSSVSDNDTVVIVVVTDPSSSSTEQDITQSSSSVDLQSSSTELVVSSSSSEESQLKFSMEVGLVPYGFPTTGINASNATQIYIRMNELHPSIVKLYSIGNQLPSIPRTKEKLIALLDTAIVTQDSTFNEHDTVMVNIERDLDAKSASFRFYTRQDGAFIFIYIEGYDDGVGLM